MLESSLDPVAQAVPGGLGLIRSQVRGNDPGLSTAWRPAGNQRAVQLRLGAAEQPHPLANALARSAEQLPQRRIVCRVTGLVLSIAGVDAEVRMPGEFHDTLVQPFGIQPPVGQDDDLHLRRHDIPEVPQQPQPVCFPRAFGIGLEDLPGHRNGCSGVDHTDGQNHEPLAQRRGINGDRQLTALPAPQHPGQQSRKARLHVQSATLLPALVLRAAIEVPQPLPDIGEGLLQPLAQAEGNLGQAAALSQYHAHGIHGQRPCLRHRQLGPDAGKLGDPCR